VLIGREPKIDIADRDRLKQLLAVEPKTEVSELWMVLIGHGTFDGRDARFNLRRPDVAAAELSNWLSPLKRPVAIINCASSSGPYIGRLSGRNRVVVTSTKSGFEQHYARFGDYLSRAIANPIAVLDKDGQTSLLEAWLTAARKTQEFYRLEVRLATEHALLDDNGDAWGSRAEFFRGIRPVRKVAQGSSLDGFRTHQFHIVLSASEQKMPPELRRRRDELELTVIQLRERKDDDSEDEYYTKLETMLVQLAELYEQMDKQSSRLIVPAGAEQHPK